MITVSRADTSHWRCEHWIRPEHQTCVQNIGSMHTLFLLGGEYFKQGERITGGFGFGCCVGVGADAAVVGGDSVVTVGVSTQL